MARGRLSAAIRWASARPRRRSRATGSSCRARAATRRSRRPTSTRCVHAARARWSRWASSASPRARDRRVATTLAAEQSSRAPARGRTGAAPPRPQVAPEDEKVLVEGPLVNAHLRTTCVTTSCRGRRRTTSSRRAPRRRSTAASCPTRRPRRSRSASSGPSAIRE